jgi:hypothetical protein
MHPGDDAGHGVLTHYPSGAESAKTLGIKMRTLLRNSRTGLYFQDPERWTRNPVEAFDFKLIDRALEFVEVSRLREMELAFVFDHLPSVTRVPIEKTLRYAEG